MKKIKLTQGKFAIVDDEDYFYLNRFIWAMGSTGHAVRVFIGDTGKKVYISMQYMILQKEKHEVYAFKNSNSLDLRKENLVITSRANMSAMAKNNNRIKTSKFRGVCWDKKSKKWNATISKRYNGKRKKFHLGYFESEIDGALSYNKKAKELFGEFAYQNIID